MRGLLPILLILCLLLPAACAGEEGAFSCALQTDGSVWITAWNGAGDEVTVPEEIDGAPVSGIGDGVFADRPDLTVNLPPHLTHFGTDAFGSTFSRVKRINCGFDSDTARCLRKVAYWTAEYPLIKLWRNADGILYLYGVDSAAVTVTVPEGVERVVGQACYQNTVLERMVLPDSLRVIDDLAFYGCSNLTLVLPDHLASIGVGVFGQAGNGLLRRILCDPAGETAAVLGTYSFRAPGYEQCVLRRQSGVLTLVAVEGSGPFAVPPGVEAVSADALAAMPLVSLPGDTREIGAEAFLGCPANRLYVPDGVTAIGAAAFAACPNLLRVRLPGGLTGLPDSLFEGSPLVTVVTPAGGETAAWCAAHGIPTVDE